jgi:hypothetical protein
MEMDKQQIAENLVRIKVLQDALQSEADSLRSYLETGEKIETPIGSVHLRESNRTRYDEKNLLHELKNQGIDPSIIGEVVVKVDRKKFAHAITKGKIPSSMEKDFSETKQVDSLYVKPVTKSVASDALQQETMERVASVVRGEKLRR